MSRPFPSFLRAAGVLLAVWSLLAAVVVGLGWLITHPLQDPVDRFDNPISRWFVEQRSDALTSVADVGTLLGETIVGVAVVSVVAVGLALWRRTWRPVVFVVVVEVGLGGLYWLGTTLDPRQRPPVKILDPGLVPDASFPSGHVGTATVLAGCVILLVRAYARAAWPWVLVLAVVPLYVLLARLYEGAHHLTDTVTSLAYATVWLLTVAAVVLPEGAEED